MFWFLLGMATMGAGMMHFSNKRKEPNYASIAYLNNQIAEHEMWAAYHKRILTEQVNQINTTTSKLTLIKPN